MDAELGFEVAVEVVLGLVLGGPGLVLGLVMGLAVGLELVRLVKGAAGWVSWPLLLLPATR